MPRRAQLQPETLFTHGSLTMVHAMVKAIRSDRTSQYHQAKLNHYEMEALVWMLALSVGFVTLDDISDPIMERAETLFSSIAAEYGIEGV